jgi:hypothetical protein
VLVNNAAILHGAIVGPLRPGVVRVTNRHLGIRR